MKKILTCFLASLFTQYAMAQQNAGVNLNEVTISGNRIENVTFSKTNRNITILDHDDIVNLPVQNVTELLAYVAGVDVRQRGPFGTQADISMQGSTFEQTVILINGIEINEPQTGHHNFNIPVDMNNIERIEIIKGPAAAIYGVNALAGAINIVTRTPTATSINATVYNGSSFKKDTATGHTYTNMGADININWAGKNQGHILSASYNTSSGYSHNTGYDNYRLNYLGNIKAGGGDLSFLVSYLDNRFDANSYYAAPYDVNAYEKVRTGIGGVTYRQKIGRFVFKPRLYARYNHDDYILIRTMPSIYENIHATWTTGGELHVSEENNLGTLGIGAIVRNEKINSTNLGDHNRTNYGGFIEERFKLPNDIWLTAGTFINYNTDYKTQLYPGIDISIPVVKQWRLFANSGMASRNPSYTDLYYTDPANLGNDTLKPEHAFSYEGGIKYNTGPWFAQASYFHRHVTDFIDFVRNSAADKWQPQNFQSVDVAGGEASLTYKFVPVKSNIYINTIRISYTYLDAHFIEGDKQSKYVLDNLRHQLVATVNYKIGNHFTHTVTARYIQRLNATGYGLLDTRIAYTNKGYMLFADATNITGTKYYEEDILLPGQWYRVGIKVNIQ